MSLRYSINHPDDNPADTNHRRMILEIEEYEDDEGTMEYFIVADGEMLEDMPALESESAADTVIYEMWGRDPRWDLRKEV